MLDAIKRFFTDEMRELESPTAEEESYPRIQLAACALLLELAYADDEFADSERAHLESAMQRHFNLSEETTVELIRLAEEERRHAVDLYQFTSLIAAEYDAAQKMVLLETMWGLVYADGEVAKHETYLMRKVSKLLDVQPGFLSEARKNAEKRPR